MQLTPDLADLVARAATNEPYRQIEALTTGQFSEWLEARDIALSWQELHHLWIVGVLRPVAVLRPALDLIPLERDRFVCVDCGYEVDGYADCGGAPVEGEDLFPSGDLPTDLRDAVLWHPLQLWSIVHIYGLYSDYRTTWSWKDGPKEKRGTIKQYRAGLHSILTNRGANEREQEFVGILALLLQAEPLVHEQLDTRVSVHPYAGESFEGYFMWRDGQDGAALLAACGLTIEQVVSWRDTIAQAAHTCDPLDSIRAMLRHMRYEKREQLKGTALRATDLYSAAETLRRYLEAYHAVALLERSIILVEEHDITVWGTPYEVRAFNARHYGAPRMLDRDRRVLRRILRQYDLDPQSRMTWFAEGDTEVAFLRHYAAGLHADLTKIGVEVMDVEGVGGLDSRRLRLLLERFKREECFTFVSVDADNRGDHLRQLRVYRRDELLSLGWHLFVPNFEAANFTIEELVEAANGLAARSGYDASLTVNALQERMARMHEPVGKAIEHISSVAKGESWGEALSQWALDHEECPIALRDEQGNRPIKTLLLAARQGQTSSFHETVRRGMITEGGKRVPRRP